MAMLTCIGGLKHSIAIEKCQDFTAEEKSYLRIKNYDGFKKYKISWSE